MVRTRRPMSWAALGAAGVILIAGCGGGSSPVGHEGGPGPAQTTPTASPVPLKVVAVKPHKLKPTSAITVTFQAPLAADSPLPSIHPAMLGTWTRSGSTAVFTPSQAYPPDTSLTIKIRKDSGAKNKQIAARTTPFGSLLRVQQILAHLHYLPLDTAAATPSSAADEAAAAYTPPHGKFSWRFDNVPSTLKNDWLPGKSNQVLRGALIAFQHREGLPADALVGEHTWQALVAADQADKVDLDKYSFVSADLNIPQRLSVWVNGHTVVTSPVNGGVSGAPTPLGTFPVYDRYTSTTMSGTNPSGSTYNDPGVPWVSYFSGGSAVHGFPRASYGTPQSVGCLELPIPTAKTVYGLISYGTLVHVDGPHVSASSAGGPAAPSAPKSH